MAEPKRIQLDATKTLHRDKKVKALPPTYRFELKLSDTENTGYAEFSYAELVKEARVSDSDLKHIGSEDPFSQDEDLERMQEIARRFEEKYNPKPGGRKKKKKIAVSEDYIDKGMGYDETDPFIDNEEAYDELVPSTLTTQFGGFYINKGDLEFRTLSESESGTETKTRKKRIKQGIDKDGRKRRRLGNEENQKRRGRRPQSESISALIKPKKKSQPTVADMLQQHKANLQRMQQENLQQLQLNPIAVERDIEPEEGGEEKIPHAEAPNRGSTISEAIESVVKAAAEDVSNGSAGLVTGSSDGEEVVKPHIENIEAPKLPDNLPPDLDDVLVKLKEAAYKSEEGKCKFFSDEVNRMLLSVELKAQELTSAQRSTIYSHLASHLPCTKETLQKRAKKLRLDQEDGKLREPMQRLKDGIAEVMPEMLEKYAAVLQACDARDDEKKSENAAATASDGEDSQEESERKVSRLPKKHFEWNDTIRKYLCDVVRIKLKCYEVSKTRIQSAEEYLKHFLEAEVKHLWPPGWMQSRILFRESRSAHFYITNRPKKQILAPKKAANPLQSVMLTTVKPAVSLLNSAVASQETEFDQIFTDKSVPLIPPVDNVLEREELLVNDVAGEERVAEFTKLFTLPIKSTVPDDFSISKCQETLNVQSANNMNTEPSSSATSHVNATTDTIVPSKSSASKSDKNARLGQQNKQSAYPSKVTDFNTFTEGSLASDMLARIICASLADFPYSGSPAVENAGSKTSVISPNPTLVKEPRTLNSKFSNDILASPKKLEGGKPLSIESRKPSQETVLHNFSSLGINIESLLNVKNQSTSKQNEGLGKSKGLPTESSSAVNLKLKDAIVPHSRQFAEAFERTADTPPANKKHAAKGISIHAQGPSSSNSASSRLINASEHINDYPSSTSPRSALESSQKIAFDLAKYNSVSSQSAVTAPYKKRNKYSQSGKVSDQWNQLFEASLGTSLLEGMKGFPFPVNSLPTPPPAHSSSPHRTAAHSQHNSTRTSSHISPGLRHIHEPKTDTSNHNSQGHSNMLSVSDVQRRQSLIQGPWKSNPSSQTPSTSLSHFITSTSPPVSNPCKSTSPNHHSSNSHVNVSPVPAHSMPQIEKVSTVYSRSHSPLPLLASPSHMSGLSHSSKTSPSNVYSPHLGQTSYSTHQSSHTVSSAHHQQVIARNNNVFDSSNPVTTSSSPSIIFTLSQDMKTANPRTN